jgi:hypothetical protein
MNKVKMSVHTPIELDRICNKTLNYNEVSICLLPLEIRRKQTVAVRLGVGGRGQRYIRFCSGSSYSNSPLVPVFLFSPLVSIPCQDQEIYYLAKHLIWHVIST